MIERLRVADSQRVEQLLDSLAARIEAALPPGPWLVGIRRRGVPVAKALARRLEEGSGREVQVGEIGLKRYGDDLDLLHHRPRVLDRALPEDLSGATVLVVDDVLYSGRTLLAAIDEVVDRGAAAVHCAVLCSRGPNEVPVHAAFVALQLDVGPANLIEVEMPPYEEAPGVFIRRRPRPASG